MSEQSKGDGIGVYESMDRFATVVARIPKNTRERGRLPVSGLRHGHGQLVAYRTARDARRLHHVRLRASDFMTGEIYVQRVFIDERVTLAGAAYVNCTFDGCIVVLERGAAVRTLGCLFYSCKLEGSGWSPMPIVHDDGRVTWTD